MKKQLNRKIRKNRIRAKVKGTNSMPRMSVSSSLSHVRVQIIDDTKGVTLCAADDLGIKDKKTKTEKAIMVGEMIAEKAQKAGIKAVVFDRGYKLYHGRVKALADAARKKGLKF